METQKYYTPTIEDLHIGMEAEFNFNGEWKEFIFQGIGQDVVAYHKQGLYRVKFLDEDDILELGWKKEMLDKYVIDEKYTMHPYYDYKFNDRENLVRIFKSKPQRPYDEIFRGDIKNKSELKKIMQMLGISE
jgi:hypothetical protein